MAGIVMNGGCAGKYAANQNEHYRQKVQRMLLLLTMPTPFLTSAAPFQFVSLHMGSFPQSMFRAESTGFGTIGGKIWMLLFYHRKRVSQPVFKKLKEFFKNAAHTVWQGG